MSDDMKEKVINAVSDCMHKIIKDVSAEDFRGEASALMQKWVNENGRFDGNGIVDALWWQDNVSDTNCFPLSRH
jgi:hypothetical protein